MKKYYIIFAVIGISLFSACRGDQQNKLIGKWEQIPFTDPNDPVATPEKIFWEFYSGDALNIYIVKSESIDTLQYTYGINTSVFEVFDGVDEGEYFPEARNQRGQYWVDELSDKQFKATKRKHPDGTTDAAYMRIELVKR